MSFIHQLKVELRKITFLKKTINFLFGVLRKPRDFIFGTLLNKYDLRHLTQRSNQNVMGPVQDDEALFLFALIKCCRFTRILEIGGLKGYSAINFIKAISFSEQGRVYTVDIDTVKKKAHNHVCL